LKKIYDAIDDIYENIYCAPILDEWYTLMNKGVCKDIYGGVYHIWVAFYFSTFFFLVLSITASILYQYFGLKELKPETFQSSFDHPEGGDVELPEAIPAAVVVEETRSPGSPGNGYPKEKSFVSDNPSFSSNSIRY
jgi:hypothetical protein